MSKRQTSESECRDCYASILWASQSIGGRIPLNIQPEKITAASVGPFYMLNELDMISTRASTDVIERAIQNGRSLFTNHVVTCEKRAGQPALPIQEVTSANEEN